MKYVLWPKWIKLKKNSRVFPGGSVVKNLPANAGGMGSIPGQGRSYLSCATTIKPVLSSPESTTTETCISTTEASEP